MKLPNSLAALEWVRVNESRSDRLVLNIADTPAWCACYPQAICVAMDTGLIISETDWLQRVCLWFAAVRDCINDCLILEANRLMLVRRHKDPQTTVQWEAALNQQLAVCDWLNRYGAAEMNTNPAEGWR